METRQSSRSPRGLTVDEAQTELLALRIKQATWCPKCGGETVWELVYGWAGSFYHCEEGCGAWYDSGGEREVEQPEAVAVDGNGDKYIWQERSPVFHDRWCCRLYNVKTYSGYGWQESDIAPQSRRPCSYCLPDGIPEKEREKAVKYIT